MQENLTPLSVGTEVTAKYKGSYCVGLIESTTENVEVNIKFCNTELPDRVLDSKLVKGKIAVGSLISCPINGVQRRVADGVITCITDNSGYRVKFSDGDEIYTTRRLLRPETGQHYNRTPVSRKRTHSATNFEIENDTADTINFQADWTHIKVMKELGRMVRRGVPYIHNAAYSHDPKSRNANDDLLHNMALPCVHATIPLQCVTIIVLSLRMPNVDRRYVCMFIKWLVIHYHRIEDFKSNDSYFYQSFFMAMKFPSLCTDVCRLLCLATRAVHIKPWRVQRLTEMKNDKSYMSHAHAIDCLLAVYKSYHPGYVKVQVPVSIFNLYEDVFDGLSGVEWLHCGPPGPPCDLNQHCQCATQKATALPSTTTNVNVSITKEAPMKCIVSTSMNIYKYKMCNVLTGHVRTSQWEREMRQLSFAFDYLLALFPEDRALLRKLFDLHSCLGEDVNDQRRKSPARRVLPCLNPFLRSCIDGYNFNLFKTSKCSFKVQVGDDIAIDHPFTPEFFQLLCLYTPQSHRSHHASSPRSISNHINTHSHMLSPRASERGVAIGKNEGGDEHVDGGLVGILNGLWAWLIALVSIATTCESARHLEQDIFYSLLELLENINRPTCYDDDSVDICMDKGIGSMSDIVDRLITHHTNIQHSQSNLTQKHKNTNVTPPSTTEQHPIRDQTYTHADLRSTLIHNSSFLLIEYLSIVLRMWSVEVYSVDWVCEAYHQLHHTVCSVIHKSERIGSSYQKALPFMEYMKNVVRSGHAVTLDRFIGVCIAFTKAEDLQDCEYVDYAWDVIRKRDFGRACDFKLWQGYYSEHGYSIEEADNIIRRRPWRCLSTIAAEFRKHHPTAGDPSDYVQWLRKYGLSAVSEMLTLDAK